VVPNLFASTDPGDLFVLRNVGNLIAPCGDGGHSESDEGEAAAIEFALSNLSVRDVIVCGHSECGAIRAVCTGRHEVEHAHLREWLRHAEPALGPDPRLTELPPERHNAVAQLNVLLQLDHLRTYPLVLDRLASGTLRLHGWYFDIAGAEVHGYDADQRRFVPIDEAYATRWG
jgi:carbonic anhydrase